jgi:elongation of very long chain fatty acids protein 6
LIHLLTSTPLDDVLCTSPDVRYGDGACGLWVQLFCLSKIPELFDTAFIVARKKRLMFLHWYHHVTVLLFCWHSYATEASTGIFFVAMNYSVHAIMFGYVFESLSLSSVPLCSLLFCFFLLACLLLLLLTSS